MKATNCLAMYLLLGLPVFSQTTVQPTQASNSIAEARCQYVHTDPACVRTPPTGILVAQFPGGRGYRPPMGPRTGYPGGYSPMAFGEGSGRHVLIGALIGFGLGAAVGAKANTDQHPGAGVKAAFLVGGVGALIGAAVGSTVPSLPSRTRRRRGHWPEEDEDAALGHTSNRAQSPM